MATVGFVGLGIMGRPMLNNLLKAGTRSSPTAATPHKLDACVQDGAAAWRLEPRRGRARCQSSSPCCPTGRRWKKWCWARTESWPGAKPGTSIIDMSSINPLVSQKVGAACAAKGVEFLDAPVSGGEPKAIEGTLAIMVGGRRRGLSEGRADSEVHGLERDAHRAGGRGQRHQARQPDHGGVQYRRHGRGADAGHALRARTPKWCSTPSRAAWPAAPCSMPRGPC